MKKIKPISYLLTLALVFGFILSACAPAAAPTEAPAATEEVAVTQPEAPEPEEPAAPAVPAATEEVVEPEPEVVEPASDVVPASEFRAAFIYPSPIGDMGWTFANDYARQVVEKKFGIQTSYVENVAEGSPDAERVIRDFAQKGYNVIFACSFGYLDAMENASKDYPDTEFLCQSGYKITKNNGAFTGRNYQGRYLAGIVAGMMTKSNKIGYVAGVPIPDVIVEINSFALGVQSVNPDAIVQVVWTNSWYDPVKETEGANALLEQGADILTYHANTASTLVAAAEKGKYGIGYPTDMSKAAPEYVLTSTSVFWETYFLSAVERMLNGTWEGYESAYWGVKEGMIGLAPFNDKVPQDVKDLVQQSIDKFKNEGWDLWYGPIYGQGGKLAIPEGKTLDDEEIRSIDWFVKGIEGTAPGTPPVAE